MDEEAQGQAGVRLFDRATLLAHPFLTVVEYAFAHCRQDGSWGPVLKRLNVDRGDAAAILLHIRPAPGEHRLVLVRQFRFSTFEGASAGAVGDGWLTELVAGVVEAGERPLLTVRREAEEETGLRLLEAEFISTFYLTPGASSEKIHLFYGLAEMDPGALDPERIHGVGDEETQVVTLGPAEFLASVEDNTIRDAKTMVAAEWMRRRPDRFGL